MPTPATTLTAGPLAAPRHREYGLDWLCVCDLDRLPHGHVLRALAVSCQKPRGQRLARLAHDVLHQTIILLLGYAWLGWDVPFAVKFLSLFAGTFLGSWICYEAVRRARVTRVLLAMKP